eukprot:9616953-Ditylum_brightwellii.AAC.1
MDNLFNSAVLSVAVLHYCPKRVKPQGAVQKRRQTVLLCVIQEELSGERANTEHVTVKAAVFKSDSHANDIIVAPDYDPKPFYTISSIAQK